MALNDDDVVTVKADHITLGGPILWNPSPIAVDLVGDETELELTTAGFVLIGEVATDSAVNQEYSASESNLYVWGSKLIRTNFSDQLDVITIGFVSSLDEDLLGVLYGPTNVVTTGGILKISNRIRQPLAGSLLVSGVTHDGTKVWLVANKAQPGLNWSRAWNDTDIVQQEVAFTCAPDATGQTSYILKNPVV
jgi:hypothetical protein